MSTALLKPRRQCSHPLGCKNARKSRAASDQRRDDYDTLCADFKRNPSWMIDQTRHSLEAPMKLYYFWFVQQQRGLPPTDCHSWFAGPQFLNDETNAMT